MKMAGTNVKIKGIFKSYKDVKVLKNVGLEIEKGDFLTILGPSGAGKTTLLKMIAGFEEPDTGSVVVNGEDILKKPVHKRNIGMLFQNYALFPHMTVRENIAYPLKIRRVEKSEIKEKVNEMLSYIQMEDYGERYPRELSGGQQQRVALGRAIVFNPDVLLLDEPLGALDKQLRKQMQIEIKRIHEERGLTTISVTHDQEEALTMSTKVCIMREGKIAQIDTPEEIYTYPKSRFVASFIGEANVLETEIIKKEENKRVIELFGQRVSVHQGAFFLPEGDDAVAIIRPEKIRIVDDDYEGVKIKGIAKDIIYVGDILRIQLETKEGFLLQLKLFTLAELEIKRNQKITVGFSSKDVVLLQKW